MNGLDLAFKGLTAGGDGDGGGGVSQLEAGPPLPPSPDVDHHDNLIMKGPRLFSLISLFLDHPQVPMNPMEEAGRHHDDDE